MRDDKVGFIRHTNKDIAQDTINQLKKKRCIAIHYTDSYCTDPQKYKGSAREAMRKLQNWCQSGKSVLADYGNSMVVGKIRFGSKVETEPIADPEYKKEIVCFKTVKLYAVKEVNSNSFEFFRSVLPRRGTISDAPKCTKRAFAILRGRRKLESNVTSLSPGQLEVLCSEYLRVHKKLDFLLLPIGRTLKDIDIYGLCGKKKVFAQVTQSNEEKEIKDKIGKLKSHGGKNDFKIFFGPGNHRSKFDDDKIKYISISDVFKEMEAKSLVKEMLKI